MHRKTLEDLAIFILRITLGAIFLVYGAQKLFGMFGGIGLEGTAKMVEGMGLPEPAVVGVVWAFVEFAGGIFLVFGILARWSAAAVALTVAVRLWKVNLMYGFLVQNGGLEYNVLIIAACVPIILLGGGSWSIWDV